MDANPPRRRIAWTLAFATALAACGKKEAEPAPAPAPVPAAPASAAVSTPEPVSAPEPAPATQLHSIALGNAIDANGKIAAAETFGARDTIYAAATIATTEPNLALGMRWKYQDGQTIADDARTVAAPGINTIEDKLAKATPWPAGGYTLEITLDGKAISTIPFRVE